MSIPFVDLQTQYSQISAEVESSIIEILRSGDYISGKQTKQFEVEFAQYCRSKHAIAVANGTDALTLALRALEIGRGDEVITSATTFIATVEAVALVGANPRLVDCQPETGNIDPSLIEAAINEKTKAIVAVHLYGRPADMDPINAIAKRHGLKVIEDAAQAQGARYKNRVVGSLADVACFSFYPSKNLGAAGDAGAIVTKDDALAERIRMIANHGCTIKYVHELIGTNSRMDTIQATVLLAKLKRLDDWNGRRKAIASEYHRLLSDVAGIKLPALDDDKYQGIHHLFAIRVENREDLVAKLTAAGIACGYHYPIGVHRQAAFKEICKFGDLTNSEEWADNELSLPMFETMTVEQVKQVCEAVRSNILTRV